MAVTATREIGGHNELLGGTTNQSTLFDVAPDGRVLVAEDLPGYLQLILVRNWRAALQNETRP
ncbi:MAG TPA: hypothetical protein VN677_10150 [Gemmatimonadaceae bacterium]|nr:hypothetical protein [Gemmatimonadaceae bacterium]